jgi:Arm DNA-binding domain
LQVTTGKKDGQINKFWVFCYALNRRERQMGLGSLNTIGLSQAREEAGRWRGVLKEGRDPIDVRDIQLAVQKATRPAASHSSGARRSTWQRMKPAGATRSTASNGTTRWRPTPTPS